MLARRYAWFVCGITCACGGGSSEGDDSPSGSNGSTGSNASSTGSNASATSSGATTVTATDTASNNVNDNTAASTGGAASTTTINTTSNTSTTSSAAGGATTVGNSSTTGTGPTAAATTGSGGSGPSGGGPSIPVEEERAAIPIARGEHGVAALDGEVYVLGGFTPTVTSSVQVYSPDTDSWRDAADFPVVFHHPNVAAVGGMIYVLGFHAGSGQRMADGRVYSYDPEANEWSPRESQPAGTERGASCVTTYQNKIYVFGGTNDVASSDASVYDPVQDSWQELPVLPAFRHHCIAAEVGGKIYIVSGRDVVIEEVQPESYVFDPVSLTYDEVAPISTPRGGAAGGALGGRIYVFGGEGNVDDPQGVFHEAEVYDPELDSWSSLPDLGVPRHGFGAAVIGDKMYLPGGSTSQGIAATTVNTVFYLQAP